MFWNLMINIWWWDPDFNLMGLLFSADALLQFHMDNKLCIIWLDIKSKFVWEKNPLFLALKINKIKWSECCLNRTRKVNI